LRDWEIGRLICLNLLRLFQDFESLKNGVRIEI
jgi:hypothetical protein